MSTIYHVGFKKSRAKILYKGRKKPREMIFPVLKVDRDLCCQDHIKRKFLLKGTGKVLKFTKSKINKHSQKILKRGEWEKKKFISKMISLKTISSNEIAY